MFIVWIVQKYVCKLGSFHGLVNATFHLVSCKLLAVWKADLNTSLAALELLGFLAEVLAKLRVADQSNFF
jgi:hypothetical protein